MARNPVAANLLLILALLLGLASIGDIRKEVFPVFPSDTLRVSVPYPGSSPEEVEQGILLKVEEALRDIQGIAEMRSEAREGLGTVTLELQPGTDMTRALADARNRVSSIAAFPRDAEEPIVEELRILSPGMRLSLSGPLDPHSLQNLADEVREEVLSLGAGAITELTLLGERTRELSIELDPATLRQYDLDLDKVARTIANQSRDLPGGQMRTAGGTLKLRSVSQAYTAEDFARLPLITTADGTRLKLGDLAQIRDDFAPQPILSDLNGRPAITLVIRLTDTQDVFAATALLRDYIGKKQATLPPGVHIEGWLDRSTILKSRIELMLRNAVSGALLVILALALFLNFSLAIWVILGIPFAVLATLATIHFLGLPASINVISVFSFILVLGILVDDGIVTAESAYAAIESDGPGTDSVVRGVKRVATATIFGAMTTVIAFIPSILVNEGFARVFGQIGIVVILCVLYSLIETKLILPAHLRHVRPSTHNPPNPHPPNSLRAHCAQILRPLDRIQTHTANWLRQLARGPYRRLLILALRRRYTTLALFIAALMLCIALVPAGIIRYVFFPNIPSDQISIRLEMPQGTPWQKTHAYARRIEQAAQQVNQRFAAQDPAGRDVILRTLVLSETDQSAQIDLELLLSEERDISSVTLARWLRDYLGPLEGTRSLNINANAGPDGIDLDFQLRGTDLPQLRQAATELKLGLASLAGVLDLRDTFAAGGRELHIRTTAEGQAQGLGDVELARQVRQAFFGAEVQRIQRGRHEVRVYVRLPESDRNRIETLDSLWIRLPDGRSLPFAVVGQYREKPGLSSINRLDRRRIVNVLADIDKTIIEPNEVAALAERDLLPAILARHPTVSYRLAGEVGDQQETSNALAFGFLVILLLIYSALAIPLRSYTQPLLIMSAIPFGIMGALIGHLLLGTDLSLSSLIGIIGLIGVVVNDSLVLVDRLNHSLAQGTRWQRALLQAGPARFRAVVLTSITTFMGLLPIQFETSMQAKFIQPMAISVAFGVLFATLVTLFLIPVLYHIAKDLQATLTRGKRGAGLGLKPPDKGGPKSKPP
ncbi:MAG: efflux RND transporter permease subunit [Cellvibrionales bacterium]|nr:efflux RND transporter permease subunit [Cellvibrionales bacterium]